MDMLSKKKIYAWIFLQVLVLANSDGMVIFSQVGHGLMDLAKLMTAYYKT